ncbi:hypothetical protein QQF64_031637 [Cirrhinus molitorella]|uniref:Uncharacterized protein n=1 Tax=Cirrhinus molitorella TaxID=172907 RepID=A0ABR3MXI8_9TELE
MTSVMDLFRMIQRRPGRMRNFPLALLSHLLRGPIHHGYRDWPYALGWLLALSLILLVPGWALGQLFAGKGSLKQDPQEIHDSCISWN